MSELVEEYLAQHEAVSRTIAKLRWLLAKATRAYREGWGGGGFDSVTGRTIALAASLRK